MNRKIVAILVAIAMVCSLSLTMSPTVPAQAATESEIEQAVVDGLAWLAVQQNGDGSWGASNITATTCFVLLKLEERAYDLGYPSPFDPAYEFSDEIDLGWDYVFDASRMLKQTPLPTQDHTGGATGTVDNPDTNGNGYGVYSDGSLPMYTTGVCLMALDASGTPGRPNDGGLDFDGDTIPDTFLEIAQEMVDWLAFAQADFGTGEGGWDYGPLDNAAGTPDQSNSGFAVLGLASGEHFGCNVPPWLRTELNAWIGNIQDPVNADPDDGGSRYQVGGTPWVNEYKTGHLIFQMTFYGDAPTVTRFQDALDYIDRHWQDTDIDPGWGYSTTTASYLTMYSLMKGLVYSGIDLLDTDGDTNRDDDWFNQEPPASPAQDFASVLVAQQNLDGSWPTCVWGGSILCTTWALLTLEKIAPPPPPPLPAVGGEVFSINKVAVLMPWIGLALILILAIGGGTLALRRHRTQ